MQTVVLLGNICTSARTQYTSACFESTVLNAVETIETNSLVELAAEALIISKWRYNRKTNLLLSNLINKYFQFRRHNNFKRPLFVAEQDFSNWRSHGNLTIVKSLFKNAVISEHVCFVLLFIKRNKKLRS